MDYTHRFLKRKRDLGSRQEETLTKLQEFSQNLRETKKTVPVASIEEVESYHGQVLEKGENEDDPKEIERYWHAGSLKFRRHIDDEYRN